MTGRQDQRCVFTGLPCSCNQVEAMVNCPSFDLDALEEFDSDTLDLAKVQKDFDEFFGMDDYGGFRRGTR